MTGAGTSLGPDKYQWSTQEVRMTPSKLNYVWPSSMPSVYCYRMGLSVPLHLTTCGQ